MGANVLYITYDGLTDPLGQSQVLPYLTGLASRGHSITILSCEKPHRSSEVPAVANICRSAGIDWRPQTYHKKPPVLSTLYDIKVMKRTAARLHRKKRFDLVHCRSYVPAQVGLWLKRRHGPKFLFDMRGFWADERVEGGLWQQSSPVYRALYHRVKRLEQELLRNADCIVSLTKAGKEELLSWPALRGAHDRITVIPCCVDFDHFRLPEPGEREVARRKFGIPADAVVAAYLGSLGTWYMLPEMVDFLRLFEERDGRAHFLFLTPDDPKAILAEASRKKLDPSLFTIRSAKRSEVPPLLAAADFGFFFIKPVYSKIASSPTKMGEMLAMGLPIITNAGVGDVDAMMDDMDCGAVIQDFGDESFAVALDRLDSLSGGPQERRERAQMRFDVKSGVDRYDRIYRDLID